MMKKMDVRWKRPVKHVHKTGSYNIYSEDAEFMSYLLREGRSFISKSEVVRSAIHHVYATEVKKTLKKNGIKEIDENHIMIEGKVFKLNGKNKKDVCN